MGVRIWLCSHDAWGLPCAPGCCAAVPKRGVRCAEPPGLSGSRPSGTIPPRGCHLFSHCPLDELSVFSFFRRAFLLQLVLHKVLNKPVLYRKERLQRAFTGSGRSRARSGEQAHLGSSARLGTEPRAVQAAGQSGGWALLSTDSGWWGQRGLPAQLCAPERGGGQKSPLAVTVLSVCEYFVYMSRSPLSSLRSQSVLCVLSSHWGAPLGPRHLHSGGRQMDLGEVRQQDSG